MSVKIGIPESSSLVDRQFVEIVGPDGQTIAYQYDKETNTLLQKQSQVIIPPFHGLSHISEDPVPEASPFSRGLMSASDKAKLDALTQTRLGVLGFVGAGFPDDGGFIQGDTILAAGSEFISIERVGNVIRFTVDSPIPLTCNCFVDGCNVSMADGTVKAIENICIGDEVITHTGKIQKVTKVMKEPYNNKVLDIKIAGHNDKFIVTPGHAIYSLSERVNSRRTSLIRDNTGLLIKEVGVSWVLSHDLNEKDFVVSKFGSNDIVNVDNIILSDHYNGNYIINSGNIYSARISNKGNRFVDGMSKGVPNVLTLDQDLMRLFGYYLAEGCCSKKNGIRFTVHRSEMKAGEIGSDIVNIIRNKFGIEPKIQNKPSCINAVDIQFYSTILVDVFSNWFNTKAANKHIPKWMLYIDPDLQYELLVGFIKGDGSKFSSGNIRVEIASQNLTNQIRFVADRCGLHFTSYNKRNIIGNKNSNITYDNVCFTATHNKKLVKDVCDIEINDPKIFNYLKNDENKLHKIDSIIERQYNGYVYNLEVENDHSYVVNGVAVHNCEECAQIFWIQDESDLRSVRPPSCNGIMPGTNVYGEMKIYVYPENSIFNPNKPNDFFDQKGSMPSLIFKRYENGNEANAAQLEAVLKRRDDDTTNVGWSMTPGPASIPECVWFMGNDREGRQIKFELLPDSEPGLLGALLYNGHTITRQMAVVTGYESTILSTNQYRVRKWSIQDAEPVGDEFVAVNIWEYEEPESTANLVLDKTVQLLPVGMLVELWQFEISKVNGNRTFKSYFRQRPRMNAEHLWAHTGGVQFGDLFEQREEVNHTIGGGTELTAAISDISDIRIFERTQWGLTGYADHLIITDDGNINSEGNYEPGGTILNNRFQASVDHNIPGLIVSEVPRDVRGDINGNGVVDEQDLDILLDAYNTQEGDTAFNADADLNDDGKVDVRDLGILATNLNIEAKLFGDRPVFLWHRQNHENFLLKAKIGRPSSSDYPPIDILLGAPIDDLDDTFIEVKSRGIYETGPYANLPWIRITGEDWEELPPSGSLRILTGVFREIVWSYQRKLFDGNEVILVGADEIFPFDDDFTTGTTDLTADELVSMPTNTTVAEVLHADFTAPALRLEFSVNETAGQESVQLQVRTGTLSMSTPYELDKTVLEGTEFAEDDFVRGFLPGEFTVSKAFTQQGFITDGIGAGVDSSPSDFKVYDGGLLPAPIGSESEKWNELIIMKRGTQIWLWWNDLLISPDPELSSNLPTPVAVDTAYFPVSTMALGKVGYRLWPGAVLRDTSVSDQSELFNEFMRGQVPIDC